MSPARPPGHYVPHNKATRVPRNFIYLDSEANRAPAPRGEVQTFRLAVVMQDTRNHRTGDWKRSEPVTFHRTDSLWDWVTTHTEARARTVVVAHNLAYDLRITNALTELPAQGWTLTKITFGKGRAWAAWKLGDRTLTMCDSYSWVPVSLEKLGELCDIAKLPLPDWDDSDGAWEARCVRDVEILADVWRRLVRWVQSDDLGNWRPTGAGQSWSAFRHRFMSDKLLAHDDDDARVAERLAAYTGRCEVWQHGKCRGGPFTEWDYSAAYAHIGAECKLPTRLVGTATRVTPERWEQLTKRYAVLAEVEVTTDVPTLATHINGRIAWPVGTFTTTVWENELALARSLGATFTVSRVWWYARAACLADFCRWILAMLEGMVGATDPVVVCAAKHWSRALVGRFGARWSEWSTVGRSNESDIGLCRVIDRTEGTTWQLLQVGHELKRETELIESADSVVSIMSYVSAEGRVRLWRLCELAGLENVVYMDTDGVITNRAGTERIEEARVAGLKRKGQWATVEITAPRQIKLGGALRASGVPRHSTEIKPNVYEGEVWQEIGTSLRLRTADAVQISTRTIRLTGLDARRTHLADGTTSPIRVP